MDICQSIDKPINRQLKIMDCLQQSINKYIRLEDMCEMVQASEKTLNKDLIDLTKELSEYNLTLRIIKNKRDVLLHCQDESLLAAFKLKKLKETTQFYFTNTLFLQNEVQLIQAQSDLHFSFSNTFRLWKEYCLYLTDYKLNFCESTNICSKDERNIRYYFFHYYWEMFKGQEWPFKKIDRDKVVLIVRSFEEFLPTKLSKFNFEKLLYWIAIIRVRNGLGNQFTNGELTSRFSLSENDLLPSKIILFDGLGVENYNSQAEEELLFFYFVLLRESSFNREWLLEKLVLKVNTSSKSLKEVLFFQSHKLESLISHKNIYISLQMEFFQIWLENLVWGDYSGHFKVKKIKNINATIDLFLQQLLYSYCARVGSILCLKSNENQFDLIKEELKDTIQASLPKEKISVQLIVDMPWINELQLREKLEMNGLQLEEFWDRDKAPQLIITNLAYIYSKKRGISTMFFISTEFNENEQKCLRYFCEKLLLDKYLKDKMGIFAYPLEKRN